MTQDQNSEANFTVSSGDRITVTVKAVRCNCLTSGAYDDVGLKAGSTDPDVYTFAPNGVSGDETVFACICTFQTADPVMANYTVKVSDGTDNFTITPIYKEAPEASFQLYFTIQ